MPFEIPLSISEIDVSTFNPFTQKTLLYFESCLGGKSKCNSRP